jgi:hypothetical protein
MPFESHPNLITFPDDTVLWRYMDFAGSYNCWRAASSGSPEQISLRTRSKGLLRTENCIASRRPLTIPGYSATHPPTPWPRS